MVHIHMLQWGDYLPQRYLQERWGARVDIRSAKVTPARVAGYMAKSGTGAAAYMAKSAKGEYRYWLTLNGGRAFHQSRGFYLGLGVEGAHKAAQKAREGYEERTWEKLTAKEAEAWWTLRHLAEGDQDLFALLLSRSPEFGA
jgi:hypothetical protein